MTSPNSDAGETQGARLPLAGVRVLDLTRALSGPFATMILGDLGASVVKVEPADGGDRHAHGDPSLPAKALTTSAPTEASRAWRSIFAILTEWPPFAVLQRQARW